MLRETLWWPWSERKNSPRAPADESDTPANAPPDTKEVEALAASLNRSSERAQTLWLSFLTFTLYLAIAAGTTTHRMLFREDPLKLPVLNIDLPLIGFYVLAPVIFVVFHFYMLLNLVLLARTARAFDDALRLAPLSDDARENFRMRIENTFFVQLLVGARKEREGFNSWLLSLMALITLAFAPVALLLFIQIKFLPYHSEGITWLHRGLLALDLALVWTLWPGFRSGWGVRLWPRTIWAFALLLIFSAATVVYATAVANFPDEQLYVATNGLREGLGSQDARPERWYARLWPANTLDLRNQDLIDDAKLKQIKDRESAGSETQKTKWIASLRLRDRDFVEADLTNADVQHAEFSGANLVRARLGKVWAVKAHFECSDTNCARLQGASLNEAGLQGASLVGAELQGASLVGAGLQGASLDRAQLQGASLDRAQLQGAMAEKAAVWRGDARAANVAAVHLVSPNTEKSFGCISLDCRTTAQSFDQLQQFLIDSIPAGNMRDDELDYMRYDAMRNDAHKRIAKRLKPETLDDEAAIASDWDHKAKNSAPPSAILGAWQEIGCANEGAPYVARGLLGQLGYPLFKDEATAKAKLAEAFLASTCDGAKGLKEEEIAKLRAIAKSAEAKAPLASDASSETAR